MKEKKTDVEAKIDRDNHSQNVTSPTSDEILVEYYTGHRPMGDFFAQYKLTKGTKLNFSVNNEPFADFCCSTEKEMFLEL